MFHLFIVLRQPREPVVSQLNQLLSVGQGEWKESFANFNSCFISLFFFFQFIFIRKKSLMLQSRILKPDQAFLYLLNID